MPQLLSVLGVVCLQSLNCIKVLEVRIEHDMMLSCLTLRCSHQSTGWCEYTRSWTREFPSRVLQPACSVGIKPPAQLHSCRRHLREGN